MGNKNRISTLIVAKPGLMRNSLLAFLRATPGVDVVALVDSTAGGLHLARLLRPEVVVVDTDLAEDGVLAMVQQLRTEQPRLRSIVLVENLLQQQQSLQAGAKHALVKGFLDERLREAVWDWQSEGSRDRSDVSGINKRI
jgi:DNA-binding NarL/FixJ family response regulator